LHGDAKAGRQHACTFDTLIYPEPETSVSTSGAWSGLSSNDGGGSNLPTVRSDSPDLIDGGPDGRGYSPEGHFRQAGNAPVNGRLGLTDGNRQAVFSPRAFNKPLTARRETPASAGRMEPELKRRPTLVARFKRRGVLE
jgi:hypothetical protein